MGIGIEFHDLKMIDYVCFVCRLLDKLPAEDKQHILSARIEVFLHESAVDFIIDSQQVFRHSLMVLYSSPQPPKSLVRLMQDLSDSMVTEFYKTLPEKKKDYGVEYNGLSKLREKLGSDERFRKFFSYDPVATNKLSEFKSIDQAWGDPQCRQILFTSLATTHTETVFINRLYPNPQASALSISLLNEVYGYAPLEHALMEQFDNDPALKQGLCWPKRGPGPLPGNAFMDNMSISELKRPFEERYAQIKKGAKNLRS